MYHPPAAAAAQYDSRRRHRFRRRRRRRHVCRRLCKSRFFVFSQEHKCIIHQLLTSLSFFPNF